ncbi:hypothetical protein D9M70_424680 [compost metagenome]
MAGKRHLKTAVESRAIDRRHHGLRHAFNSVIDRLQGRSCGRFLKLLHIVVANEVGSGACNDYTLNIRRDCSVIECPFESGADINRNFIHWRIVDRDDEDFIVGDG